MISMPPALPPVPHKYPAAPRLAATALGVLALAATLSGCGAFNTRPVAPEDRQARTDCNAESDRVFAARNRYQMSERSSTDTPYSSNTLPSNPTAGLSDQYEQEKLVDDCLAHGTDAGARR